MPPRVLVAVLLGYVIPILSPFIVAALNWRSMWDAMSNPIAILLQNAKLMAEADFHSLA
jgi:hypothetical protein